ncbi:hypothetical protein ASG25_17555 [Rhizobium sp. Leaf384]|nr:hypothetical protein ASG25_17555 [Rhizobium sp. Leaf384]
MQNYRIDVIHQGVYLATSVMTPSDLRLLLDVTGQLLIATFEEWIEVIVGTERREFMLDPKGSVIYVVTPVSIQATHGVRSLH